MQDDIKSKYVCFLHGHPVCFLYLCLFVIFSNCPVPGETISHLSSFSSLLFNSILFYSILFYSFQFYSILFYSILFYSILFYSIIFYSILFYSILYIQYNTIKYNTIQYNTIQYSIQDAPYIIQSTYFQYMTNIRKYKLNIRQVFQKRTALNQ